MPTIGELVAENFLTIKDVAEREQVTRSTVRTWIYSGKLKALELPSKTGIRSQWAITVDDYEAFHRQFRFGKQKNASPQQETREKPVDIPEPSPDPLYTVVDLIYNILREYKIEFAGSISLTKK